MLNAADLSDLREANPVTLDEACERAESSALGAQIRARLDQTERVHPRSPRRRRLLLTIAAAAAALAVVVAATPVRALIRDVLPFWDEPAAPHSVKVDFSTLNSPAAPPGMSPDADVENTREVMQADFAGKMHTLYVSPAKNNGYCFEWTDSVGGCNTVTQQQPLDVSASQGPPHDASKPPVTRIPKSEMDTAFKTFVPYWLAIDAVSPTIASVVIEFSDGTTAQPEFTWISAPINAGFLVYEVPNDRQSAADHVTEVRAYDANGNLVEWQPMAPMSAAVRPGDPPVEPGNLGSAGPAG